MRMNKDLNEARRIGQKVTFMNEDLNEDKCMSVGAKNDPTLNCIMFSVTG